MSPILQRVALAANSSLDLEEVLDQLARLTLEAIAGERCAIFLLDPAGRLVPRMAAGRVPNEDEFQRFLGAAPIELREEPARWQAFNAGRALYFADLASTPIVPAEFVEVFGARCALVMPLMAHGEPLGLLSVDWSVSGHDCSREETALVEAIGAYVALAIRNSRLFEGVASKTRTLERLVDLAAALNSAASLTSVLDLVCSAFEELLGTSLCSVNLIDGNEPQSIRAVAVRGRRSRAVRPRSTRSRRSIVKAANDVQKIARLWNQTTDPIVYPDLEQDPSPVHFASMPRFGSAVVFPLSRPEGLLGYVLAAFPECGEPSADALASGQGLAELAATATARAHMHQEVQWRLQRVEILHRLSDVVAGAADLGLTFSKLNAVLPRELGIELDSIVLANAQLREGIGASAPSAEELGVIRSWRAIIANGRTPLGPRRTPEGLLVPISHRRRVLGALKVSVDPKGVGHVDNDLLMAIAAGCAEIVYKAGLHRELAESELRLAVVAERERIARDLHDSVGQLLTGLGMRLVDYAQDASDPLWRERLEELRDLAARGSREIREAIQALLFLQVRRQGLSRSLRELTRKFEATTGIRARFRVSGQGVSLATVAQDALFRVAHEALMNVERHSGASSVSLALSYNRDDVTVVVTDDGVGLKGGDPFEPQGHFGLLGVRRLINEVGGELELWNVVPNGLRIEGRIYLRARAREGRQ